MSMSIRRKRVDEIGLAVPPNSDLSGEGATGKDSQNNES